MNLFVVLEADVDDTR